LTASRLFDFLGGRPSCSIERYVIGSAAFCDLRRSLRSIIVSLAESGEGDADEISGRLRSVLSEWLTAPVRFDNSVLLALAEMGTPAEVEGRWGRDIRGHYHDACRTANELLGVENPVRTTLANVIQALRESGRSFRIFCHRRSRADFASIFTAPGSAALPDDAFIHTVVEYREAELFGTLVKVGPLRSRGWGSAPDALLTAPRFDTLIQVVWSGCGDEPDFGYDPVSAPISEGKTADGTGGATERYAPSLQTRWKVTETLQRDNTVGRYADPEVNEFEVFAGLAQPGKVRRATLVQVDEGHGILYPPHSRVLGLEPGPNSIDLRLPGDTLLEGMFLIIPVIDDARLAGLQAANGYYSRAWKERLNAELRRDPVGLEDRLRDAGLQLVHLRACIERWCRPPSTVIHAPQSTEHFEILIDALGLGFDANAPSQSGRRAAWWQLAWDEIRRARGEAIQNGFQEQQVADEQALAALRTLDAEIRENIGRRAFQLRIPPGHSLDGEFRFFQVLAIDEGFQVPQGELRKICDLSRIDQWRI